MLELLDVVRVKKEYPELSLTPQNRGTIVDIHNDGEAYTVEFIDEKGETIEKALYKEFTESELEYVVTKLYSEDVSLELQIKEAKKFFGLRPDQSFQDLDVEVDDDEEIIHGLDLPNEVAERNSLIMMKRLGITEEEIENCEIDDEDYICDDREKEMCDEVKNMSKEEREEEFQRRFGKYIENDDNFEEIKKQYQAKTPSEWEDEFEKEKERLQKLKGMAELDDVADKADGYVVPSNVCEFDGYVISRFRKYCDSLGKKSGQLTSEELQEFHTLCSQFKKVKYIGESDSVCLIHGKIYGCIGEEHGEYRIIDEEGYDADEEIQGYLYPKRFFVEVNDD